MSSIQQLVDSLPGNWKLKNANAQPIEETVVAQVPNPDVPGTSQTVNRGTGSYYVVVQDDSGHEQALFLKADPIKGGLNVKQSGINDQTDADKKNLYDGNLNNLSWTQSKPLGAIPNAPAKPTADLSKWIKIDADGNDATRSGKPPIYLVDPADASNKVPVPKDPAGTVTKAGDNFYVIKPDGSSTLVTDANGKPVTDASKPDVYNVPGIGLVQVDPTKPAGQNSTILQATPKGMTVKDLGAAATKTINGQVWVAQDGPDGQIVWQQAKDDQGNPLPADVTWQLATNDPRSSVIQLIGSDGSTKTIKKEDFHPPPSPGAGTALTPDTTAPYLVTIGDDGKPVFTDNKNNLSIQDATRQFIEGLGYHVAAGTMSEAQAQDLIKNITSNMTAQASIQNAQANALTAGVNAGQSMVQGATQGAQAGANLLNQRSAAAQNAINSTLGILGHTQRGLLAPLPSDFGANLTGGAAAYATQLMGGDDVAAAAANMVKAADPTNQSGLAAQGYAVLQQMLQKYKDITGSLHPLGAQANAQGTNGFSSPPLTNVTPNAALSAANQPNQFGFNPQASTAALNAAGFMDTPQGRQSAMAAGRGDLLGVTPAPQPQPVANPTPVPAPGNPYLSYANQVPGANYGSSVYVPGAGFVAPNTVTVPLASNPVEPAVRVTTSGVV
jgi:hypothetical protein